MRPQGNAAEPKICRKRSREEDADGDHLGKKQRLASRVIAKQKLETGAAKKMGAEVQITETPRGVSISGTYWRAPRDDSTIPQTQAEIDAHVEKLIDAMRNNRDTNEVSTTKQFLNRWGNDATYYSGQEFNVAANEVVVSFAFDLTSPLANRR